METRATTGAIRRGVVLLLVVVLAGCTPGGTGHDPRIDSLVERLVSGLARGDLSEVPTADPERTRVDVAAILSGMGDFRPEVSAGDVRTVGTDRQVTLDLTWNLAGTTWTYQSFATFTPGEDEPWLLRWEPGVIHPELTSLTRLVHRRVPAERGTILGANEDPLTQLLPVIRIGIDKSRMDADQARRSARKLATALEINVDRYVDRVAEAGEKAFVEALTVRGRGEGLPKEIYRIPGALLVRDEMVLPTRKERAAGLIGTVGEATAERVEKSQGRIQPGDTVGLTGLQLRYDDSLRGLSGTTVRLEARAGADEQPTPSDGPSATPSAPVEIDPVELFVAAPVPGKDLTLSLETSLQDKADRLLASRSSAAAIAVVRPSDGAVLALSTNDAADGQPLANFGRFPPGSTFKIATALALMRTGMDPDDRVDCTDTVTVGGRTFKNYSDFPRSRVGAMSLTDAVATSCNTALISQHDRLSGVRLREAAISLGMGADHDAGFPAFYGEVPDPSDVVGLAAAEIGQGTVEASPMAMAGMAASVAAGRTVVPWLLTSQRPNASGKGLTKAEASALRRMMTEAVRSGTAQSLQGVVAGAKTGTAEYGTDDPPATHAWMIAWTDDDLAIAVLVTDGESGSQDAAPLIKDLLT